MESSAFRETLHNDGYALLGGGIRGDWLKHLAQMEDREPLANGGHQRLHQDMSADRPCDIVVWDADVLDEGSLNPTDARRRSILIGYFADPRLASQPQTARLRDLQMNMSERPDPSEPAGQRAVS